MGGLGSTLGSGNFGSNSPIGDAGASPGTTNDGLWWPWSPQFLSLGLQWTILVWARNDALTNFSSLFSIPYQSTWANPFAALSFSRDNALSDYRCYYAQNSSTPVASNSATGYITAGDPFRAYLCTRSGTSVGYWRNGVLHSTGTFGTNVAPDFTNKQPITLLNHSSTAAGEGTQGVCPLAAVWSRALLPVEIMWLYQEPWAFMQPPAKRLMDAGAVASAWHTSVVKVWK